MENEKGFPICRLHSGRLTKGPTTEGTPTSVWIRNCPPGSQIMGTAHSHPGGDLDLSEVDRETGRSANLEVMVVWNERGVRIHRLR